MGQPALAIKPPSSDIPASFFEGLFVRALQPQGQFLEDLKKCGFDPGAMRADFYPAYMLVDCLAIARRHVYPGLSEPDADRALGKRFMQGFLETIIGRVTGASLSVIGIKRMLKRLPQIASLAPADVEFTVEETGETSRKLTMINPKGPANFLSGVLECVCRKTGTDVTVKVLKTALRRYEFSITW